MAAASRWRRPASRWSPSGSSSAQARGARIYGEVLGYGITSDAMGVGQIDPEGDGLERAMRIALESAGVEAGDVAAVWASATGLTTAGRGGGKGDRAAAAAASVAVLTPKVLLGEPMGVGATLSAALALKGWQEGDGEASPRGPVLVNSTSLGGTNFSVLLAPYET